MHNDSKLGLLAGVAGVVVAAVLLAQQPNAAPPPASVQSAPQPAATPVKPPPPATASVVARGRPEIEAKTTSRSARSDDDD